MIVAGAPLGDGGLCGVVPGVCDAASGITSDAASSVVHAVLHALSAGLDGAVGVALTAFGGLLSTDPRLTGGWYHGQMATMTLVAGVVTVPLLFVATIGAVVRQDPARLARVWLVALPAAVVGSVAAGGAAQAAVTVTDGLDSLLVSSDGTGALVGRLGHQLALAMGFFPGGLLPMVVAGVVVLATLVLSLELVVRSAAVYLTVLFLPLVFCAAVWPPMVSGVKRALEVLAALILSKFVIVAALALGVAMLEQSGGFGNALAGLGVLLMAAFAPFAVLRLMPVIEVAAIGHLEGRSRQPLRAPAAAVDATMATASSVAAGASMLARAAGGGGGSSAGGGSPGGDGDGGSPGGGGTPGGRPAPMPAPTAEELTQISDLGPDLDRVGDVRGDGDGER